MGRSCSRPTTSIASARRCSSPALDRLRKGSLVCVFDATDRIQHMFWRYIEKEHPAARGREQAEHQDAIRELYKHNDALVGRVMERLRGRRRADGASRITASARSAAA